MNSTTRAAAWRARHPEQQKANANAYYHANADRINDRARTRYASAASTMRKRRRASHLRVKYGITEAEYDAMLEEQGGVCAICRRAETSLGPNGKPRRLAVDHNHKTGEIRGLLCRSCNRMVGYARDDAAILASAVEYIACR